MCLLRRPMLHANNKVLMARRPISGRSSRSATKSRTTIRQLTRNRTAVIIGSEPVSSMPIVAIGIATRL